MNTVIACLMTSFLSFVAGYMLNETYTYDYERFVRQLETELRYEEQTFFFIGNMEVTKWKDGSYVIRILK